MLRGTDKSDDGGSNGGHQSKPKAGSLGGSSATDIQSSTFSCKKDLQKELSRDFQPGEFDVVCNRGKGALNAPGNIRYRTIITDNLQRYSETTSKQEKSAIVLEIVESIQKLCPKGGFVRHFNGKWYTVTNHVAREKTGQSFRDLLHNQYRSSTKAKRRRKKEEDLSESCKTMAAAQGCPFPSTATGAYPNPTFSLGNATNQVFPSISNSNSTHSGMSMMLHSPPFAATAQEEQMLAQQEEGQHIHQSEHHWQSLALPPIQEHSAIPGAAAALPSSPEQRTSTGLIEPVSVHDSSLFSVLPEHPAGGRNFHVDLQNSQMQAYQHHSLHHLQHHHLQQQQQQHDLLQQQYYHLQRQQQYCQHQQQHPHLHRDHQPSQFLDPIPLHEASVHDVLELGTRSTRIALDCVDDKNHDGDINNGSNICGEREMKNP